ncbi:NADPH:quinone reductase-like Zn-dependent oxidoreductase [Litoreibacter halocynthiae]|uniref:NADPH:quinone reductase-like Zn-dependent oxidoreductase n=1 Tax=Litoreibacter halocynthiae TaxID=1242689 RepID=A0A4R7LRX8_9RHOB|nr:zinc-binding dehydrogenase [Litoreibacter halocynthiae]TDT77562.1 NADPH:quinone reductase-like Zn-dependent oxidoreductase [Litoreibacter halocynthiae]
MTNVMTGMVLTGHGGPDMLEWRDDIAVPTPKPDEVLIEVAASSVNNTDINTRIGWYSQTVRGATDAVSETSDVDASWSGTPLGLPRIQGADVCGRISQVGRDVDPNRIGERVLVRTMQNHDGAVWTMGSECDGGFAQFCVARAHDALVVDSSWSDLELATLPCAYSTAEGMLQRASLKAERVLITGASGGVGAAAVQLAKMRGAHVTAVTTPSKADAVRELGADAILTRDETPPRGAFDVLVDLVAGPGFPDMLDGLADFGRYVCSGAIAGPIVELDVRKLYLRDLSFFGSTFQPDNIMPDLISYVEAGRLRPAVTATFPLRDLKAAQAAFAAKTHVGKIAIDVAGGT